MSAVYNGIRIDEVTGVVGVASQPNTINLHLKNEKLIVFSFSSKEAATAFQDKWLNAIDERDKELHERALEIAKATAPIIHFSETLLGGSSNGRT